MTNSVFRNISEKLFTPGSPDSLLSPENALNLRITAAFIKACVGSILPCLFHKTVTTIFSDGSEGNYRGSQNNDQLYGRGILYVGSLLKPTIFSIGKFLPLGGLEEGYSYFQDDKVTCHFGIDQDTLSSNAKWSDGFFIRGISRAENIRNESAGVLNLRDVKIEGFPLPVCGGEVNLPGDGPRPAIQGTFSPNGTFTGSISYNGNQILKKGVFSFKEYSNGTLDFEQLSGVKQFQTEDGRKKIFNMTSNYNEFEGTETAPDGSILSRGIFSILNQDNKTHTIQLSGTYTIELSGVTHTLEIIDKTTARGRLSWPDGSFMEGVFSRKLGSIDTLLEILLSGSFRLNNETNIIEGKTLSTPGTWEGTYTYPNGSVRKGVFSVDATTNCHWFNDQHSGTFKIINPKDKSIKEGTILPCGACEGKITPQGMGISEFTFLTKKTPEGAVSVLVKEFKYSDGTVLKAQEGIDTQSSPTPFEGSIHYPNGDYKTGLFSYSDLTEDHTCYCFLSGTVRKTYPDGRVFQGTDGNVMRGVVRYPDGREEYVLA